MASEAEHAHGLAALLLHRITMQSTCVIFDGNSTGCSCTSADAQVLQQLQLHHSC
jgi:hypothetical protein